MSILIERDLSAPMRHTVTIGKHRFSVDMSEAEGGSDSGPDPHDLYDAALGACKALTLVWYAQRKGIDIGTLAVDIERDDSEEAKGIYRLAARIALDPKLSAADRQKLMAVADRCPVQKLMTTGETRVTTTEAGTA
jgi:putative redox protein